jgi:hypothetical protein
MQFGLARAVAEEEREFQRRLKIAGLAYRRLARLLQRAGDEELTDTALARVSRDLDALHLGMARASRDAGLLDAISTASEDDDEETGDYANGEEQAG